jgi:uncharacterized membrane protein HdeD (DUF308 family)
VGKSALLGYLTGNVGDWTVANAVGVESEMELAYSGLHQLCAAMLDRLDQLPTPQRDALATVFGLSAGAAPDRFLVGLATLTLFADVAEQQPLVCIVDDAQWLDDASAQILSFVGRRLLAERIALVCAARTGSGDHVLSGLAVLQIDGLGSDDVYALVLVFGAYALAGGVLGLVAAIGSPDLPGRGWRLVGSIAGIAVGVLVFTNTEMSAVALLYVIGAYAIVLGAVAIRGAFLLPLPGSDSALLGLTGAVSVLFGIVMFVEPGDGAIAVLALIAAYALIVGLAELTVAIGGKRILRSLEQRYTPASPEGSR